MKKILLITIIILISIPSFSQIGLGLTTKQIKQYVTLSHDSTFIDNMDSNIIVISAINRFYLRSYFIKNDTCGLYTVTPLSHDDCEIFFKLCDSKFNRISENQWETVINNRYVIIEAEFNELIHEHVFYFAFEIIEEDKPKSNQSTDYL